MKFLRLIISFTKKLKGNSHTKPSTLSSSLPLADILNVIKYTELALLETLLAPFHANVIEWKVFSITSAVLPSGV